MAFGKFNRKSLIKACGLGILMAGAILVVRIPAARELLTADALERLLGAAGLWAPLLFVPLYAAGVCLFVPATLLSGFAAALFGPYLGFACAWTGAMLGAGGAFLIARYLGRDLAKSLARGRLEKYDAAIGRNGFAAVLYLRLVYAPFTAMNFAMGLTRVSFRDFLYGTGLGILVGTFIFTFFIGTLRDAWISRQWTQLLTPRVFFSVGLFVFSFFIPKIVNATRGEAKGGGDEERGETKSRRSEEPKIRKSEETKIGRAEDPKRPRSEERRAGEAKGVRGER